PEGVTHLIVEMEPGTGSSEQDNTHKLSMPAEILKRSQLLPEEEAGLPPVWSPPKSEPTAPLLAQVIPPPPRIRVGTNCSCRTCTSVSTMSLETYVMRGLKDEWIASWRAHSLRAGAIAYRAYGSYHLDHPISGNYDICDNACCQVNRPGGTAATDSA